MKENSDRIKKIHQHQRTIVTNGKHSFIRSFIYSFIHRENNNLIISVEQPVFDCYCASIYIIETLRLTNFINRGLVGFFEFICITAEKMLDLLLMKNSSTS